MTPQTFRWSIVALVGIIVCTSTGCSRSIELHPSPEEARPAVTHSLPSHERVPLVMDSFQQARNGAPQNPSTEVERRILHRVQDTHLFSTVIPLGVQSDSVGEKIVSARVSVEEAIEPHSWMSAFKGIIIGGSMFLLSPFIDLEYGYTATIALELQRWDGQVKRYEGTASGTVQYKLFGATPVMIDELKGYVTEACLTAVTGQLVHDTTLYMANSAPLPDSSIRMVTVKSKRPSASQATQSIVPVTRPTAP